MKERVVSRIKERRTAAGQTQEDLAGLAGVSRQSIISIERGRYVPSLALALRFARIFDCATDELFHLQEES